MKNAGQDDPIIVRVLKYDGTEYRRWNARFIRREASLIVLDAQFEEEVVHESLGTIPCGTRTIEYYWTDRWYNVFQFLDDERKTRLFYCNVNTPPCLEDRTLTYVDLDIDVLVQPDLTYEILDLDDFENHSRQFSYPEDLKRQAHNAMRDIVSLIENARFPFEIS